MGRLGPNGSLGYPNRTARNEPVRFERRDPRAISLAVTECFENHERIDVFTPARDLAIVKIEDTDIAIAVRQVAWQVVAVRRVFRDQAVGSSSECSSTMR
jgi:hypothetical protein